MNKKRLKIALAVLDAVKSKFFETQEFFDSTLKEEWEREKMTVDEVFFLLLNLKKKKKLAWINIFVFRFGTIVIIFFVCRCGKAWQIVKRQYVYQKK